MKGIPSFFFLSILLLPILTACQPDTSLEDRQRQIADSIRMNDSLQIRMWLDSLVQERDSLRAMQAADTLEENR
ncbi:MAG: hypothetical protein AAF399_01460 [Bacteroidota bacterium]